MEQETGVAASLGDKLRDIALAEVRAACSTIDGADDVATKIHNVRRSCKRMRGCLRLLAPALGDCYGIENEAFRDVARALSALRDAAVVIATFERYVESAAGGESLGELATLSAGLKRGTGRIDPSGTEAAGKALRRVRDALIEAERRIGKWPLENCTVESLVEASQRTYTRARSRYLALLRRRSEIAFHEWRKECKYHWIQLGLLHDVAAIGSSGREALAHELSETLGAAHDLAVLIERLSSIDRAPEAELAFAIRVATRMRVDLEDKAIVLGQKLFEPEVLQGVHA